MQNGIDAGNTHLFTQNSNYILTMCLALLAVFRIELETEQKKVSIPQDCHSRE